MLLFAACILAPLSYAHGFSKMGEDCTKCHTLTKEEANAIAHSLDPRLNVINIETSPVKTLWEITIEAPGQKIVGYVDFSKRYLIMGDMLDTKEKKDLTREKVEDLNKIVLSSSQRSSIPLDDAIVMGDRNAPIKVIVFSDPKCPYCARLHAEMKKVIASRKDMVFFIKMFPLAMHKGADEIAKAIVCEKSLALLDDAFAGKEIPPAKCTTSAVDENIKLGESLGIKGTPDVIFPDGRLVPGAMSADAIIKEAEKK